MKTSLAGLALGAFLIAGCQGPDVGQPCDLAYDPGTVPADYLEMGNTNCENLVCLKSPAPPKDGKPNPYCSKPCVSNSDCSDSDTGLVCRPVSVDDNWLNTQATDEQKEKFKELLGGLQPSNYCAAPLPQQ